MISVLCHQDVFLVPAIWERLSSFQGRKRMMIQSGNDTSCSTHISSDKELTCLVTNSMVGRLQTPYTHEKRNKI